MKMLLASSCTVHVMEKLTDCYVFLEVKYAIPSMLPCMADNYTCSVENYQVFTPSMQPGSHRHKQQHRQTGCYSCRNLGTQVFSRPLVQKDQVESWRESLYRVYKSGQQSMRVAVYGTKHDASLFEELLKEASQFEPLGTIGDTMIDTACLNIPKVSFWLFL